MRWAQDARGRLQRAALELFVEQGFAATTVPQITARAGLTTRTFFRHFADKREVVFAGREIQEAAAAHVAAAPPELSSLEVIRFVLHRVAEHRFEGAHAETVQWRGIIDADPDLRDRDARKRADLVRATTAAFEERGEPTIRATVLAELGVLAFQITLDTWAGDDSPPSMSTVADVVLREITGVVGAPASTAGGVDEPADAFESGDRGDPGSRTDQLP